MASLVVYLALFILAVSFVVEVDAYLNRYISLVSDLHEYYRTSTVSFVISSNNRCFEDYTSVYSLSRDFSRKYDYTSLIHLDQVDKRATLYQERIGRHLLVIFLRSLSDIAQFTDKYKSYVWLVIFTSESESSEVCEYCKSPKANSFGLRFDTEMLVLCCNSLVLKDWWSVNGNHTEVSDFASWTDDKRDKLKFLAPAEVYSRRYEVKGAGFRIGLVVGSEFAYEVGDEIHGLFGDILAELKRCMNFTITGVVSTSGYGNWNSKTKSWMGAIGRLLKGEADLGVADFTITTARLAVLDYTIPLAGYRSKLFIKDKAKSGSVDWTAYLKAFSVSTWIIIILLIILASILVAVNKLYRSSRSLTSLIVESYIDVLGIFCQQGLSDHPAKTPLQIAYFSIFVMALIIYATYSGLLISFLTVTPSLLTRLPFTTLEGFVEDGSYQLIAYRDASQFEFIANSNVTVLKKMMKLMKPMDKLPDSFAAGAKQVCQERVALYSRFLRTTRCKTIAIDSGYENTLALILPAGSQYTRVINYHLQRFKENGVMHRLKHIFYNTTVKSVEHKMIHVDLWDVAPVLATLAIGMIISLLVLLAEVMFYALEISYLSSRRRGKNVWYFWRNRPIDKQFTRGQRPNNQIALNQRIIPMNLL